MGFLPRPTVLLMAHLRVKGCWLANCRPTGVIVCYSHGGRFFRECCFWARLRGLFNIMVRLRAKGCTGVRLWNNCFIFTPLDHNGSRLLAYVRADFHVRARLRGECIWNARLCGKGCFLMHVR